MCRLTGHFLTMKSQLPALRKWGESRSLFLARRNMQTAKSRINNIVLLVVKNIQIVKFSQEDLGTKNMSSNDNKADGDSRSLTTNQPLKCQRHLLSRCRHVVTLAVSIAYPAYRKISNQS